MGCSPALEGLSAVQVAAHGTRRSFRAVGGYAGAAVAGFGILSLLPSLGAPPDIGGPARTAAAAALALAGTALLLTATARPGTPRRAGGRVVAALAAVIGMVALVLDVTVVLSPAVAVALVTLAGGAALAGSGFGPSPGEPTPRRPAASEPAPDDPAPPPDLPERREFADTLLHSMNEAVMVLDANYRVIDVNRRWRELTGHRAEDAVGQRPPYPWAPDAGNGDRLLHRVDGTDVPVLATLAAVPDAEGRPRAYVATYVDIGDRKRAEEALTEHAAQLEGSNTQLREANSKLESALAFKTDLMTMLSHDMAQPVSSIASLAELLTSDWADLPEDIRLELATKIDKNTSRLIRMMNDLSLLFRLDTGSVTARRTPVPVREVVQAVAHKLDLDGIELVIDDDVSALADRGHLWHVVQNLLTNAVAYGSPPIEVRAYRQADRVVLVVQDRGTGIPAELVPNLFDRFMRGAGLGLFIVRHLMEANGGSVHYERAEPRGARLIVDLEPGTGTPHDQDD